MSEEKLIIVAREKHGDFYYDASTPEAWAKSSLAILTERFNEGYWYHDPRQETNEFSLNLRREEEEAAAPDLTDAQLAELPEVAQAPILKARQRLKMRKRREAEDIGFYETVKTIVEEQDAGFVTVGRGRHERQEPKAWRLLYQRSDHEYEGVGLETLRTGDPDGE